jgi:hypothetical protein
MAVKRKAAAKKAARKKATGSHQRTTRKPAAAPIPAPAADQVEPEDHKNKAAGGGVFSQEIQTRTPAGLERETLTRGGK